MTAYPRPSRRVRFALDAALLAWVAAWLIFGAAVAQEVRGLSRLSDTIILAAGALRETATLVEELGAVPFVGDQAEEVAARVRETARSANRRAVATKESVRDLSRLLGISIALIPGIPLAAIYVPLRIGWLREERAVRRALRRRDPGLDKYLAHRAVQHLAYERLREATADPWQDLAEGRYRPLADAELARLGLRRP